MNQEMSDRRTDLLQLLFQTGAIKVGKFTLASGAISDMYGDMRVLPLKTYAAPVLRDCMFDLIGETAFDSLGCDEGPGPTLLVGAMIAEWSRRKPGKENEIEGFVIRKEAKDHGTKNVYEGTILRLPVLVEDVWTTGRNARKAIAKMPVPPVLVVAIMNRQNDDEKVSAELGVRFRSIFTFDDIRASRHKTGNDL